MTDLRLCTLCDNLVDLEAQGVRELPRRGGNGRRITVIDAGGRLHVVTTRNITERILTFRKSIEPEVISKDAAKKAEKSAEEKK